MNDMGIKLLALGEGVVFALIVFLWMWVAKRVADLRVRRVFDADREIEQSANTAVALRRAGLYLGLAVGMGGALAGWGGSFQASVIELLIEGAVLTVLLIVALELTDRVVIHGIRNDEAVRDGNVAVGLVELGVSVATGLVALGSFAGEGGGLASAIVFFFLGQAALLVLALAYEQITPFSVIDDVRQGNAAAGLMLGGILVAFGFILRASIAGPSHGWAEDLTGFGFSAVAGLVLLLLLNWPVDRIFLPGLALRDAIETQRNIAAVSVAVAVKIALALVIAAVLI
jgi:uncharacterized membrane protein YjfL (UPF0719 family)